MKVYAFVCEDCGCPFEELVEADEEAASGLRCPLCYSSQVREAPAMPVSKTTSGAIAGSSPSCESGGT